ncbi:hypothetical protein ONZ51_g3701 [Trametes cubensis]|uniref:C3H1-type domain-containing protein n=1 Tax=Trametes cubensis TaxID=1111947 RepID=A0AAD7TXE1_9APHY|nr:hypothetical protein ONZ51_g3701 [Trametes cubensis]
MSATEAETQVATTTKKVKKLKPARKQVKPGEVEKKEAPQTGKEYNIWYNKWAGGDREDSYSNKTKSQTRCNIKRDAGLTRANTTGNKYCCLFFARGCCPYGWECEYLHMLPDPETALPDTSKDCFARDKFADYRDDMGGAQRPKKLSGDTSRNGGEIEKIRVLQYRSVAFVTYKSELNAQFAKEAMACQSLDNDEILNVRWATEDPNPTSKVAEKRRLEEMGREAIQAKMDPRIVDAVRAMRALEEGVEVQDDEMDEDEPSPPPQQQQLQQAAGILSADALEGLKYFAEIRKKTGLGSAAPPPKAAAAPPPQGLGLADYASDDE